MYYCDESSWSLCDGSGRWESSSGECEAVFARLLLEDLADLNVLAVWVQSAASCWRSFSAARGSLNRHKYNPSICQRLFQILGVAGSKQAQATRRWQEKSCRMVWNLENPIFSAGLIQTQANLPNLRRLFVDARTEAEESSHSRNAVSLQKMDLPMTHH